MAPMTCHRPPNAYVSLMSMERTLVVLQTMVLLEALRRPQDLRRLARQKSQRRQQQLSQGPTQGCNMVLDKARIPHP